MIKKTSIAILFIFIIPFCFALQIGISPEKIDLVSKNNQKVCSNFTLHGDNISFIGEVLWSEKESKNIQDYNIASEEFGLKVIYDNETFSGKNKICFTAKSKGNYYGVLKYKAVGSNFGIATWINLKSEGVISLKSKQLESYMTSEKNVWIVLLILFEIGIAIYLIYLLKKK